ncbi:C4-type zinc-finger of DNA polymerase delta [Penicillium nucicola]|uniref:C4-type zinc-finger of DNA polymerase delta n=1 Tax=Penicillium nucicola TaxID=1850975 RepID=UPI002545A667|nr:C4-type zinc-finger of DNA polymerase delta [Penicillium nucicola]KAJ5751497.1 C4-type zinc-finger of DNA polymerase delta [Penicillium nucicola]
MKNTSISVRSECHQWPHIARFDIISRFQRAEKQAVNLKAVPRSCVKIPASDSVSYDGIWTVLLSTLGFEILPLGGTWKLC